MSLPKTSEAAAKQILDSTRVFRELVRVKKESEPYEGSLYWKKAGSYEYLVRKVRGKVTSIGARGPETERQFEEFKPKQEALKLRLKRLKASVEVCQRLNKAVKAGAVPTPVVEVLNKLDESGLSEGSVVLGTPALFAYGQPAGVRLEDVVRPDSAESVVDEAKYHLQVLLHAPERVVQAALPNLKDEAKVAVSPAGGGGECSYHLVVFSFHSKHASAESISRDVHWCSVATEMAQSIDRAARFEQVVIGKTGAMATMRTVDPRFFALVNCAAARTRPASLPDADLVRWQASLVDSLIADDLLVPKLPEAESRRAVSKIEELVFRADQ